MVFRETCEDSLRTTLFSNFDGQYDLPNGYGYPLSVFQIEF